MTPERAMQLMRRFEIFSNVSSRRERTVQAILAAVAEARKEALTEAAAISLSHRPTAAIDLYERTIGYDHACIDIARHIESLRDKEQA